MYRNQRNVDMLADQLRRHPLTRAAPQLGSLFGGEQGRYLAAALGEPLLQGLNEVASRKPQDPVGFLATFLHNFANRDKDSEGTQEESVQLTSGPAEPLGNQDSPVSRSDSRSSELLPRESLFNASNRDEFGQTELHFAAARAHGRGALLQILSDADLNIAQRDELYRTARDVAIQAGLPDNVVDIDKWVLTMAARGETDKLAELLLDGYDHILDVRESPENGIMDVAAARGHRNTVSFLGSIPTFEEQRERAHSAIRQGMVQQVNELLPPGDSRARLLATARNATGRCALHIAVLCQQESIVGYLAQNFPETLQLGDNLERTPLHYAMGVDTVESLSKILIKAGAKRVPKDLRLRQPSYYFMNQTDIQRLQEEEESRVM